MQKRLVIGRGVKILDKKKTEGVSTSPPAILRVKEHILLLFRWDSSPLPFFFVDT